MKLNDNLFVRAFLLVLLVLGSTSAAVAQRTVTGTVTDAENGDPLIGASVLVTGTSTGTVTDFDGNYSLNVPANAESITFSYTGYGTQTIVLAGQSVIDIKLSSGELLDEVVVIGYGTTTRKEVTSAVTSVKAEDFNVGNINDPTQLIQGKVAGLNISRVGSNPNGGSTIRLRGISSFGANNSPLIIIDGVVGADLNLVDPNDIESIDVLKDGSAAAIYGIQASAGVILVTTKSGREGQGQFDYRAYVALDQVAKAPETADAPTYLRLVEQTAGAAARAQNDYGANTNWVDELTRTGVSHVHNLSYSGGTASTVFRASINYRDIQGIGISNDGFQQLNGRLNIQQKALNDRLTVDLNVSANDRRAEYFNEAAFRYAVTYNPAAPVRVDDPGANVPQIVRDLGNGIYGGFFEIDNFDYFNPVAAAQTVQNSGSLQDLLTSINASFKVTDNFTLSTKYSRIAGNDVFNGFASRESRFGGNAAGAEAFKGTAQRRVDNNRNDLFEVTGLYDLKLGNNKLELLAGYSWQKLGFDGFGASGRGLPSDAFGFNNLGVLNDRITGQLNLFSYQSNQTIIGFFGRARFNIGDIYNITASIRRDGTSRNGPENKWDIFPAISASADLAEALDISGFDNLKLRAGYGITGSIPPGDYDYLQAFGIGGQFPVGGATIPAIGPNRNANPFLQFEKKGEFNVGLDFALMDYRLTGSIDYYTRTTRNLLFNAQVPSPPFLFGTVFANLNNVDLINNGVELSLGYKVGNSSKFSWEPNIVFSTFNTQITQNDEVPNFNFGDGGRLIIQNSSPGAPGQNDDPIVQVAVGEELGNLWTYVADLEASRREGRWVYVDQDGDGEITQDDKVLAGNALPNFSLGFQNTFRFGKADLSFFFRGDFGHDIANTPANFYGQQGNLSSRSIDNLIITDRFQEGILGTPQMSDYFIEDASFVALDNAQIGYTFNIGGNSGFRNVRVYAAGQNLFYITNYSGVDPNVRYADRGPDGVDAANPLSNGIDRRNTYFLTRTITFGVNVGF